MKKVLVSIIVATVWFLQSSVFAQDQSFFFGTPQARFVPNYQQRGEFYNRQHPTSYQEESIDSFYHPQQQQQQRRQQQARDLQTSDLPIHLQQTLPQYRFSGQFEKQQQSFSDNFHASSPHGFRPVTPPFVHQPAGSVVPSTHRPNYSHLFRNHNNNHDPQTETFLGEITIESPADLPPEFKNRASPFKPFSVNAGPGTGGNNWKEFPDNSVDNNQQRFLNHRTRIFAPEGGNGKTKTQVKDYFVDHSGEVVYKATRSPSTTPVPATTFHRRFRPLASSTERNIDPLLEDIKDQRNDNNNNHKNDVEVVKGPITLPPDKFFTVSTAGSAEEYDEDASTADYDYTSGSSSSESNLSADNSYDVLTMKPGVMVKDDNFREFIDSTVIDEESATTTSSPAVINTTTVDTTEEPTPTLVPPNVENTSDTWVVVASVQTSRSVSGARYLPNAVVEQATKTKLLNELETTTLANVEDISAKPNTSTESLIDKLDRVQSDLSSYLTAGFNGNNITVIKEGNSSATTMMDLDLTTTTPKNGPTVVIKKFSPNARPTFKPKYQTRPTKPTTKADLDKPQGDDPLRIANVTTKVTVPDVSRFLPAGYRAKEQALQDQPKTLQDILKKATEEPKVEIGGLKIKQGNLDALLPADYKTTTEGLATKPMTTSTTSTTEPTIFKIAKEVDISKFLPPGYKDKSEKSSSTTSTSTTTTATTSKPTTKKSLLDGITLDDISAFLPPGYKLTTTSTTAKPSTTTKKSLLPGVTLDDISAFLPPGFNLSRTTSKPLKVATVDDVSAFLPPGFKEKSTEKPKNALKGVTIDDVSAFLPPGYKAKYSTKSATTSTTELPSSTTPSTTTSGNFKVVFPSRPGGIGRKSSSGRLTTPRSVAAEVTVGPAPLPTIQKGWPSRATTEFTGWPTPSTTPISIEKLLEAARNATFLQSSTSSTTTSESEASTTEATTTTTTSKPTTPGYCVKECDLAGTIKLVGGAKWVPELLDRNTREWQILANEVQSQLEDVFSKSNVLNKWYKKIRIDGFSEGSVLVDYLVELNDLGRQVDTLEIKKLFHDSLEDASSSAAVAASKSASFSGNREPKSTDINSTMETVADTLGGKLSLGNFVVDPKYTDFIVLPKHVYPTVGMADENVLLPQWAIAVIVIGLASLLFVIIFGVTVLVNRQKSAKKKAPSPLTEDMLNELNKNHMGGGIDNYAADDLYNMEDVWNDRHPYDMKYQKKRSTGSIHDNSMANLYDSWRSEWNGYYYNAYYGNHPGSSHSGGYGRRRSDYDTNF